MRVIEFARRQKGLIQKELGEHANVRVSQNFISLIERGEAWPTPDQRKRLAAVLGVDPSILTDELDLHTGVVKQEQEA